MNQLPGLDLDVYFGDAEEQDDLDWRNALPEEDDEDEPTPEERAAVVAMIGFDPAEPEEGEEDGTVENDLPKPPSLSSNGKMLGSIKTKGGSYFEECERVEGHCVARGEAGDAPKAKETPAEESQASEEPPFKSTQSDEVIVKQSLMDSFRIEAAAYSKEKPKSEMTVGDQLRGIELYMKGKASPFPLTEFSFTIKRKLEEQGIKVGDLSNDELFEVLSEKGYVAKEGDKNAKKVIYGVRSFDVMKSASPKERQKLIPYFAKQLAKYEGIPLGKPGHYNHQYYGLDIDELSSNEATAWADALEEAAQDKPMVTKYDESEKKNDINYDSGLTIARVHAWAHTKNYEAFLAGFAQGWSTAGSGTRSQQILNRVGTSVPQNEGKRFWTRERTNYPEATFNEERAKEHFQRLKKSTEDFYKKKFGKKNAASFDLSTKELTIYRGVGGAVEAYLPSPIESWTTDKNTPKRFGKMMAKIVEAGWKKKTVHTVLEAKVTYADILFSYETMKNVLGWPAEKSLKGKKEFVPFGGALQNVQAEVIYETS